jgi:hypothetical protein
VNSIGLRKPCLAAVLLRQSYCYRNAVERAVRLLRLWSVDGSAQAKSDGRVPRASLVCKSVISAERRVQ